MGQTIPGGIYLDDRGRPQDASGSRLKPLPDTLTDAEKERCELVGLVSQKQVDHYSVEELIERFGISERTARIAKGEIERDEMLGEEEEADEDSPFPSQESEEDGESEQDEEQGPDEDADALPDALSAKQRNALREAGYTDVSDLKGMEKEELQEIDGVGPATAGDILDALEG